MEVQYFNFCFWNLLCYSFVLEIAPDIWPYSSFSILFQYLSQQLRRMIYVICYGMCILSPVITGIYCDVFAPWKNGWTTETAVSK
jgi:hypothetical protein